MLLADDIWLVKCPVMLSLLLCVSLMGHIVTGEYLFTMPRSAFAGSSLKFCLELLQFERSTPDLEVEVEFRLRNGTYYDFMETLVGTSSQACGELLIEAGQEERRQFTVEGRVNGDQLFVEEIEVMVNQVPEPITLIQTDKPIYKPGQKVQFRVLTMDHEFIPVTEGFPLVFIESPGGQRLMQWMDVPAPQGLVSLEMPLSEDPPLGDWKVIVSTGGKTVEKGFKVDEYVLPKYEVTITAPTYLLPSTKVVSGTVCAKYTYGKPVQGKLKMNVAFLTPYLYGDYYSLRPTVSVIYDIDGCREFHVSAHDLRLGYRREGTINYSTWGDLSIQAEVTEEATGITIEASSEGPGLSFNTFTISIEDTTKGFYKPGFPYRATVKVRNPDGTPAPGELIEIRASDMIVGAAWNQNLTTDVDGNIPIVLGGLAQDNMDISIWAGVSVEEGEPDEDRIAMYPSSGRHNLEQWYSPSGSYIHMEELAEQVESGTTLELPVYYNTPTRSRVNFKVVVKAGNTIVHRMEVENSFVGTSSEDLTSGSEFVIPRGEGPTRPPLPPMQPIWRPQDRVEPPFGGMPSIERPGPEGDDASNGDDEDEDGDEDEDEDGDEETVEEELIVPEVATPLGGEAIPNRRRRRSEAEDGPKYITHFMLDIPITSEMAPDALILVYYIREDLEVVASTLRIQVKSSFKNPVKMSFSTDTVRPGGDVTLQLGASPLSFCAVGVVDKSVQLLGGNSMINPQSVFYRVNEANRPHNWFSFWREDDEYCSDMEGHSYPYARYSPTGADAMFAFRDAEMVVLTDAVIASRPCERRSYPMYFYGEPGLRGEAAPDGPVPMALGRAETEVVESESETVASAETDTETVVRSFFPETWLWDLYLIGDAGTLDVTTQVPDTITEWVGSSLCTNAETGVGVTELSGVTVFQPFFLSFTLPYSAVRGEIVPILITIFNYMSECLPMRVTLADLEGFTVRDSSYTQDICVCGGQSRTAKYFIMPTVLGEIDIEATAVAAADSLVCGNEIISTEALDVSDGVQRQLLIEAEGVPRDLTKSFYMCPRDGPVSDQVTLTLPDDLVPDSERGALAVIGDVMGPTLSNLKSLLRVPYGCGEQNMASLVPNIFVLEYLASTGQNDSATQQEAENNMGIGYQRQLNYRHHDSSYSAFGDNKFRNNTGSLWLTAFVVKSLLQASNFIAVDEFDIRTSIEWLLQQQEPSGCFPRVGKVFSSYMKGGLGEEEENKAGLTAFVLVALLEKEEFLLDGQRFLTTVAISCLDSQPLFLDTYTLSVMLYAYTLYDPVSPRRQEVLDELNKRAITTVPGQKYWTREETVVKRTQDFGWWYHAPPAEVEMTSYILLSILTARQDGFITDAQPIVQWLTKQRNPYGGFSSTQDTVVALQALSMFGRLTYSADTSLTVEVKGDGADHVIQITGDNRLLYQTRAIGPQSITTGLDIATSGVGCALVQVNLKFNVYVEEDSAPKFDLSVDVYRSQLDINNCAQRRLEICTSYLSGLSNMAIVAVKMVTGWSPIKSTLNELVGGAEGVEKFEKDNNYVQIYFDQLSSTEICISFEVLQEIEMSTKPSLVRVYDYYEPEFTVVTDYAIKTTCGTKEEIPFTDNDTIPDEFVQRRLTEDELNSSPPGCPVCDSDEVENLTDLICSSRAIYKAVAGRSGDYPLKIKANLRTKSKKIEDAFVTYTLNEECSCPLVTGAERRVLIFSSTGGYQKVGWRLDGRLTILLYTKTLEREVRLIATRKNKCARRRRRAQKMARARKA